MQANPNTIDTVTAAAERWLTDTFDRATQAEIRDLMAKQS